MPLATTLDPDPMYATTTSEIRRGLRLGNKRALRDLIYGPAGEWCRALSPNGTYYCSRPLGHPTHWKHVAANYEEIVSVWGGNPDAPVAPIDPEDGTPADPADVKVDQVQPYQVYRLRSRRNLLQALSVGPAPVGDALVRPDGLIDVLDFERQEIRALPLTELVPTDQVLTPDQMVVAVQVTQRTRMAIREEAIENMHKGHWCGAGLDDALRDMGLEKYRPEQSGNVTISMPYRTDSDTPTTEIAKAVREALDALGVTAAAAPPGNDLNLRFTGATVVRVTDVHRR